MKRPSLAAALVGAALSAAPAPAQLAPPATGGAPALDQALQRLAEGRRVLVIGAHPDDEDTAVLAYAAQALGAEAAYLSLTRGEGGQNLIGNELGLALGVIRSQELMAARAIDGARQYFTRAYDFGYTRSLEETERFWPRDSVLKDAVRVVRRFRPHVIVSVFSGTPRDGHGQHQMAGVIARLAYQVAGDPHVFPELATEERLAAWTPLKLYRSTRFDSAMTTVTLPTGDLDPRTGKTYFQLAMASRSQHRSQSFGVLQPAGPRGARLGLMERRVAGRDTSIFAGVPPDTSWVARWADSLRRQLVLHDPGRLVPGIAALVDRLARDTSDCAPRVPYCSDRLALARHALAVASGIVVDAVAARERMVAGEVPEVEVTVYNAGSREVKLAWLRLELPPGWSAAAATDPAGRRLAPGDAVTVRYAVTVPAGAATVQPYFLQRALAGALYDWSRATVSRRGLPFDPPVARVSAAAWHEALGPDAWGLAEREVAYRFADQASGEVRHPIRVVPAIEVRIAPERLVWSSRDGAMRPFTVSLLHNGADSLRGDVAVEIDGWPAPAPQPFALGRRGETRTLVFHVVRPPAFTRGAVTLRATARTSDGRRFGHAVNLVAYPHIRPTPYVAEAMSEIHVAPVTLPALRAVGYVRGAADRVPDALAALGVPITLLDGATLARGDLSRFDAIVVGARAYETDSALVRYSDRLLAYARNGGHLVVQYQQYEFVRGGYAPYRLEIRRPHDRITDETAPVRLLEPAHPVFHRPNEIGPEDFTGWPQERGLYFAGTWDDRYRPLLEMQDPDMPPMQGGLLVAEYGAGTYVYTGISFFRSLPAGVPGPVRLFLNLLALGER